MIAKEYLSQIRVLGHHLQNKQEELARLVADAERITPAGGSGSGGGASDRIGNAVARIVDMRAEIAEETVRLAGLRNKIINELHALHDDRYEQILYKRYVECKSLERISVEMNYSYQPLRRMHGYALLAFERKWLHNATSECVTM